MNKEEIKRQREKLNFEEAKAEFEERGWKFELEEWEDHHKGTPEETWHFKSPRMTKMTPIYNNAISTEYGYTFNKKELLKLEATNTAFQRFPEDDYLGIFKKLKQKTIDILAGLNLKHNKVKLSDKELIELALKEI